ncbi:GTP-binding protein Obg/CgtA [Ramicandelaber brevisporus]|nr:GTP-binding protein Obg/CgtA [Ramicandelaber brevisporus]
MNCQISYKLISRAASYRRAITASRLYSTEAAAPAAAPAATVSDGATSADVVSQRRLASWKLRSKSSTFADLRRVLVTGGAGGAGCVAFERLKYIPFGPANGGSGGRGGSVYLEACPNLSSLHKLTYRLRAEDGSHGKGMGCHGESGNDLIIKVPVGTLIREVIKDASLVSPETKAELDAEEYGKDINLGIEEDEMELETPEQKRHRLHQELFTLFPKFEAEDTEIASVRLPRDHAEFLEDLIAGGGDIKKQDYLRGRRLRKRDVVLEADMATPGEQLLVARGGCGGPGNPFFVTSDIRRPRFGLRGLPGTSRLLELELKMLADVGLIGLCNAGKSTLLGALAPNTNPRVAPYPFTTLFPQLGTVFYKDAAHKPDSVLDRITVADIPGLVQGSWEQKGVGHTFLRHVERSSVLVYVIDVSGPQPWEDFTILQNELEHYRQGLSKRPTIVIANKADITEPARSNVTRLIEYIANNTKRPDISVVPVSALYRRNIERAMLKIREAVMTARATAASASNSTA